MRWLGLFALIVTIVHGLFYDYLYNGNGTALLFYPLGMAMIGVVNRSHSAEQLSNCLRSLYSGNGVMIGSLLAVIAVLGLNLNKIIPLWYANLGAIQMSQAELKDFPTSQWATSEIVPQSRIGRDHTSICASI